jgi:hypothetical protein
LGVFFSTSPQHHDHEIYNLEAVINRRRKNRRMIS